MYRIPKNPKKEIQNMKYVILSFSFNVEFLTFVRIIFLFLPVSERSKINILDILKILKIVQSCSGTLVHSFVVMLYRQ